jgi:hypothetical protein
VFVFGVTKIFRITITEGTTSNSVHRHQHIANSKHNGSEMVAPYEALPYYIHIHTYCQIYCYHNAVTLIIVITSINVFICVLTYLFICVIFSNALSTSECIAPNDNTVYILSLWLLERQKELESTYALMILYWNKLNTFTS